MIGVILLPLIQCGRQARPGHAAAFELAALDGDECFRAAGVTGDRLDVDIEELAQDPLLRVGGRAGIGAAQYGFSAAAAGRRSSWQCTVCRTQQTARSSRDAADPFELAEIDRDPAGRQQRVGDLGVVEHVDDRAVLRRVSLEMLDRAQAAGARHVDHDDSWSAGDVTSDMARNQPRVDVVAAAGANSRPQGSASCPDKKSSAWAAGV